MIRFVKLSSSANIDGLERHPGDPDTPAHGYLEVSVAEAKRLEAAGVLDGDALTAKELDEATAKATKKA